jgi:nucleolar protein 9
MPKENKQRGRRGEKASKRKREDVEEAGPDTKRQKSLEIEGLPFVAATDEQGTSDPNAFDASAEAVQNGERPFYGLLDEQEQEYFRRADELLELNDFPSDEERSLFLANVFKEAEGKELKIANSQSSSRLMERLILMSTPAQKKKMFETFGGHFPHLIQHRFASHCCETLFLHSAPIVTEELTADSSQPIETKDGGEAVVSMENLFLYTLNELEGQIGFLLTDRFASHALRVLLVVLSGQPLSKASTKSLLQSRKKENIGVSNYHSTTTPELSHGKRAVPSSFQYAINKIISDTAESLDDTSIPVLVTHQTANPALQLLVELELTRNNKEVSPDTPHSIVRKLLPDPIETENSKSAAFLNGLVYEPIGSRLLETLVTYAPGKTFKQIYRSTFKDRIGSLARNEIAGYVVVKVLERVSREDLEDAIQSILPQIPNLVERSRTTVVKVLLERAAARNAEKALNTLTTAVKEAYGSDPSTLLLKMTHTSEQSSEPKDAALKAAEQARQDPNTLHGSLLAQSMLAIPGSPSKLIQDSLLTLNLPTLLHLAHTTSTSHILQAALTPTPTNLPFRRKLTNIFLADPNSIVELATSKAGSHVLDAFWDGTTGAMMLKERICSILAEQINVLREDWVGRVVLRNWMVELFMRKKVDWIARVKEGEGGTGAAVGKVQKEEVKVEKAAGKGKPGAKKDNNEGKSAIQLAREKFAAQKAGKIEPTVKVKNRATGANSIIATRGVKSD